MAKLKDLSVSFLSLVKTPAPEAESGETDIEKAIAKGFTALEGKIDDKITKALAKGVTETDPNTGTAEESFA